MVAGVVKRVHAHPRESVRCDDAAVVAESGGTEPGSPRAGRVLSLHLQDVDMAMSILGDQIGRWRAAVWAQPRRPA